MMKAKHYLQYKKTREEMAALQKDNAKLREEVAMLMHTQKLHKEAAAKAEPAVTAADEWGNERFGSCRSVTENMLQA